MTNQPGTIQDPANPNRAARMGVSPDSLTREQLADLGHKQAPPAKIIRAMCLSCVETAAEARKCPVTSCPLWPMRLGRKPAAWRAERSEAQAEAGRLSMARLRATGRGRKP